MTVISRFLVAVVLVSGVHAQQNPDFDQNVRPGAIPPKSMTA